MPWEVRVRCDQAMQWHTMDSTHVHIVHFMSDARHILEIFSTNKITEGRSENPNKRGMHIYSWSEERQSNISGGKTLILDQIRITGRRRQGLACVM